MSARGTGWSWEKIKFSSIVKICTIKLGWLLLFLQQIFLLLIILIASLNFIRVCTINCEARRRSKFGFVFSVLNVRRLCPVRKTDIIHLLDSASEKRHIFERKSGEKSRKVNLSDFLMWYWKFCEQFKWITLSQVHQSLLFCIVLAPVKMLLNTWWFGLFQLLFIKGNAILTHTFDLPVVYILCIFYV